MIRLRSFRRKATLFWSVGRLVRGQTNAGLPVAVDKEKRTFLSHDDEGP